MDKVTDPIPVLCVKAEGGTNGAKHAFDKLESKLPSLNGRRFYGAYDLLTREYRACVESLQAESAEALRLEGWTIPGGKYTTRKVMDWQSKL